MAIGMIVLAGGIGKRIGRPVPKQFLLLGGKPLLAHVLEKVLPIDAIADVVITCPASHIDETRELIDNHAFDPGRFRCVEGGATRQASVLRGLEALGEATSVVIHEAVRPLVTTDEFRALLDAPDPNAMFGIPIPFTVLKGRDYVDELLERSELVNVQLPQKFDAAALRRAHEAAVRDGATFTEDASLFTRYAEERVRILAGSERNLKITVPTDLLIAEAIYADLLGRGTDQLSRA
jgi:2-C-methyl-D-erythritol 4-phosphate cytidylyltransferase